ALESRRGERVDPRAHLVQLQFIAIAVGRLVRQRAHDQLVAGDQGDFGLRSFGRGLELGLARRLGVGREDVVGKLARLGLLVLLDRDGGASWLWLWRWRSP